MNEIDVLQKAFGFDEPSVGARDRARAALLERMGRHGAPLGAPPPRRRFRWSVRIAAAAATAAAAVAVGAVVVTGGGTDPQRPADRPGEAAPQAAALPYAKPAGAAEFLENVAWTAGRRPWVEPRPGQFLYLETISTVNKKEISDAQPNGALVPGQTETLRRETWWRIDGQVYGARDNGGQVFTREQTDQVQVAFIPYADLAGLDTPEKVEAWYNAPKKVGAEPGALLSQYTLPPAVEAAMFRWLARQPNVKVDEKAVNLDGRPAIALTFDEEGYLHEELLFDPQTYTLIGDRLVAYADHTARSDDMTRYIKKGDVFRQEVIGRRGVVDKSGDTP